MRSAYTGHLLLLDTQRHLRSAQHCHWYVTFIFHASHKTDDVTRRTMATTTISAVFLPPGIVLNSCGIVVILSCFPAISSKYAGLVSSLYDRWLVSSFTFLHIQTHSR